MAVWNKGLTKENDERMKSISMKNSCKGNGMHKSKGKSPWNKDKTKEDDERLNSISHKLAKSVKQRIKDGETKFTSNLHRDFKQYMIDSGIKGFESEYLYKNFIIDEVNEKLKIAIEIDGDYWHANPAKHNESNINKKQLSVIEKDKERNKMLKDNG